MVAHVDEIRAWLDAHSDEMAALVIRLVAEETENPPGRGLGRCAQVLHEAMDRLGLSPELIEVPPSGALEEPCIIRGTVGCGDKLVYFHGHFDVVPVQDRTQFHGKRRDGRIIGRGTADMKGGIVSMIYGAAAAKELGLLGDGRIAIHLVCDEETGSVAGSGYLREHGLIDPGAIAMVTAEPSSGSVWNAARGAVSLRISLRGKEAHVGQANLGVNAFQQMLHVARPLEQYAQEMMQRHTRYNMDPNDPRGSMVVVGGMSGSGSNFNVVPGVAWFSVDSRFNPEEDIDVELRRMTQIIYDAADAIDADVTIETTQFQPPAATDETHQAAQLLAASIAEVDGEPARFEMCAGVLDVRWYAQLGIPAFGYGAGRLDVSHGPSEYIDEAAMRNCAAVYALYANRLLA